MGDQEYPIFAHEGILSKHSAFFRAALHKEWIEGQTRRVHLPDDEPELMYAYIQWIYSRKFSTDITRDASGEPRFNKLAKLYVLGEKLLDGDFQDNVANAMILPSRAEGIHKVSPGEDAIDIIYTSASRSSPARQLLVDMWVAYGCSSWVQRDEGEGWKVHQDFKDDLVEALLRRRCLREHVHDEYPWLYSGMPCKYHTHTVREACTAQDICG